ncbi:MAG: VWA-like domain-containing protein [Mycobacteriaceae bacterium]
MDVQKLAAAKLWLISPAPAGPGRLPRPDSPRDLPYLAHALYALITVASSDVARMTVDEWWRVYVNPDWLTRASTAEVGREVAHVSWHLLADHAGRARDQDVDRGTAEAWTTAADVSVAHTLAPDRLGPDQLPTAVDRGLPVGLSAEEYYALLGRLPVAAGPGDAGAPLDQAGRCGSGADGVARGHEHGAGADLGAVSTFEGDEIRRQVAIAYRQHAAGRRGTLPGDALRWVRTTLDPTTAWEPLLSGAVRRAVGWAAGRGDFTYRRPSRRASVTPGVVLPGQHRPVPQLAIVVDTSGSVDDRLLARALGEVDAAIAALGVPGSQVTVYSVDAAVHSASKIRRARDVELVGAGGTDLRVGLRRAEQQRPRPDVIIVFTDGDTPWPATPPPGAAVVVALLGRERSRLPPTPCWVTRVECLLDPWS